MRLFEFISWLNIEYDARVVSNYKDVNKLNCDGFMKEQWISQSPLVYIFEILPIVAIYVYTTMLLFNSFYSLVIQKFYSRSLW